MSQSEFLIVSLFCEFTLLKLFQITFLYYIFLCVPHRLAKVVRGALDRTGPVNFSQADLDMYLSACKFLDTSLAFPPERIPLFQM